MGSHVIENTTSEDFAFVCELFEQAIIWQHNNGHIAWNGYDQEALQQEIARGQQYKLVKYKTIAAVFSVCYDDPVIWRQMDNKNAVYLHRIVANQAYRGQRLFDKILNWAKKDAEEKGLSYVRMDTWGGNTNIVDYYKRYGFRLVEYYTTPDTPDLAPPYRNLHLALLELNL